MIYQQLEELHRYHRRRKHVENHVPCNSDGLRMFMVSLSNQRLAIFEPGPEPGPEVPVVGPGSVLCDAGALRVPREQ